MIKRMSWIRCLIPSLCLLFAVSPAVADEFAPLPLWEYGVGLGYARFYHYPASDQTREWVIPVPVFQYRGEILRADDRDGARAYLWREKNWNLELGGGGLPAIKSSDNRARQGMEDLPWRGEIGPQLVMHITEDVELKVGVYQVFTSADLKTLKTKGQLASLKAVWFLSRPQTVQGLSMETRLAAHLTTASRDFHASYYEVTDKDVTVERPAYRAREGLLSYEMSVLQSFHWKKLGVYFGGVQEFFDISANRESPLHRVDRNLSVFAGVTYTLGESERKARSEEESRGAIEKLRERMQR